MGEIEYNVLSTMKREGTGDWRVQRDGLISVNCLGP